LKNRKLTPQSILRTAQPFELTNAVTIPDSAVTITGMRSMQRTHDIGGALSDFQAAGCRLSDDAKAQPQTV
jgi:hypothetical protein